MDRVSVIITTYKRKFDLLERAIKSVLNQSYSNIECIVVDDNTTEGTYSDNIKKGLVKYNNVIYASYKGNKGACFARNYGASLATGDYYAFLDDDDEWEIDKVSIQVETIKENNYDMVTCDAEYITIDKNGSEIAKEIVVKTKENIISLDQLLQRNIIGGCSFPLISKSAFLKSGGFNNSLPSAQDYDLWIKICSEGKVYRIDKSLVKYYVHEEERITSNIRNKIIAYEYLVETYAQLSRDKNKYITEKYNTLAKTCFISKELKIGVHYLLKAYKKDEAAKKLFYCKLMLFGLYKQVF